MRIGEGISKTLLPVGCSLLLLQLLADFPDTGMSQRYSGFDSRPHDNKGSHNSFAGLAFNLQKFSTSVKHNTMRYARIGKFSKPEGRFPVTDPPKECLESLLFSLKVIHCMSSVPAMYQYPAGSQPHGSQSKDSFPAKSDTHSRPKDILPHLPAS